MKRSSIFISFLLLLSALSLWAQSTPGNPSSHYISVWKSDNPSSRPGNNTTSIAHNIMGAKFSIRWVLLNNTGNETTTTGTVAVTSSSVNTPHVITGLPQPGTYRLYAFANSGGSIVQLCMVPGITDPEKLLRVEQWGNTAWRSMNQAFALAKNMTLTASDAPDLLNCPDISLMFRGATSFNQPIANWNVSRVTNMDLMFWLATSFNQPIGNWDVGNVTTMQGMFQGATSFNQPIGDWIVSKVTNMKGMFFGATSFNRPIGNWNVSKVTNMNQMFRKATAFDQEIGSWRVDEVTDMKNMFFGATSFNRPIGNWKVNRVTNMASMF